VTPQGEIVLPKKPEQQAHEELGGAAYAAPVWVADRNLTAGYAASSKFPVASSSYALFLDGKARLFARETP
jgi:hypothetical protein